MRLLLLPAILLLAGFAGCLDDSDGSLVTAQDALPIARAEARDWSKDAQLMSVTGLEIGDELRQELAEELADANDALDEEQQECEDEAEDSEERAECAQDRQDEEEELEVLRAVVAAGSDEVGDGKASVWFFSYGSESKDSRYAVIVDARKVLLAEEGDGVGFEGFSDGPLGNWSLDSNEAAAAAKQGDEAYADAAGDATSTGFSILLQGNDRPIWLLGIEAEDGDDEVLVAVDANNGTLVPVDEVFGLISPLMQEFGLDSGSFTAGIGGTQSTDFDVEQSGHGALVVHVRVTPPPVMPVTVTVTDPAGTASSFSLDLQVSTGSEGSVLLTAVPRGEYQVDLATNLPAQQTWSLSWCTDGLDFGLTAFFPVPACDEVPDTSASSSDPFLASETISRWMGLLGL